MLNCAWYFKPLNPVAKEQCIEKLLLLNLLVRIVTKHQRTLFTMSSQVWPSVEFKAFLLLNTVGPIHVAYNSGNTIFQY